MYISHQKRNYIAVRSPTDIEVANAPARNVTVHLFQSSLMLPYRTTIIIFLTPVLNSQGMKKIALCDTKKYKNEAGMNLTPPPPSQNSHAVRWHCTTESERRVTEIKS